MEKKLRFIWWGILGVLLIIAGWKWLLPHKQSVKIENDVSRPEIVVYITGAVSKPGLINLSNTARLDDAIKQVGLLPEANIDVLNLAEKLKDGQKITIPYKQVEQKGASIPEVSYNNVISQTQQISPIDSLGRVNINNAHISDLDKLPGIGPVLAQRIIDYRNEHGYFLSIEDLKEVSGIGSKIFEKLAPQITVGP